LEKCNLVGGETTTLIFTLHFFLFLFCFLGVTKYKRICVFKSQIESWMVLSHVHYQDIKMHIKWEKTCPKLDNYCTPHVLAKLLLSNCPTIQDKSVDHKYLVPFDLVHSWQIAMVALKKLCELLPHPPQTLWTQNF